MTSPAARLWGSLLRNFAPGGFTMPMPASQNLAQKKLQKFENWQSKQQPTTRFNLLVICLLSVIFLIGILSVLRGGGENEQSNTQRLAASSFPENLPRVSRFDETNNNLSASKSAITGILDAKTKTSSMYWTLEFKNDGSIAREAKGSIKLPIGSVVSRATEWIDGIPEEAAFSDVRSASRAYAAVSGQKRDPLMITSMDHNVVAFRAFPVPAGGGTLKIRIGITAPMAFSCDNVASVKAPYLVSQNFVLTDGTSIVIDSPEIASIEGNVSYHVKYSYEKHLNTSRSELVENSKMRDLDFTCVVPETSDNVFAVRATHSKKGSYILAIALHDRDDSRVNSLSRITKKPQEKIVYNEHAAYRLSTLWAREEVYRMLAIGDNAAAKRMGQTFRIVTPVTAAVVLERESDYQNFGLNRERYGVIEEQTAQPASDGAAKFADEYLTESQQLLSSAPQLQGATNGTVGPSAQEVDSVLTVRSALEQEGQLRFLRIFCQIFISLLGVLSAAKFMTAKADKGMVKLSWGLTCLLSALSTLRVILLGLVG